VFVCVVAHGADHKGRRQAEAGRFQAFFVSLAGVLAQSGFFHGSREGHLVKWRWGAGGGICCRSGRPNRDSDAETRMASIIA